MSTITVSVTLDTAIPNPEASAAIALLLASLGVSAPVVVETPVKASKPRKERAPLTEAQKKIVRDRFAAGRAKAQAKRDAAAKPVGGNAADKARERALNNSKEAHKGVRPQPAPKK